MRVKPGSLSVVLFILISTALSAQEFFAAYVEGTVEHRTDEGWAESVIGDTFSAGTEVRLGDDGFLEVISGNRTIRYRQEGTFRLGDTAAPSDTESTDVGGLIRATVSRFARTSATRSERAISAGVRASEAAQEPTIDWAGNEPPEELIEKGIDALNNDQIEDASFLFEDAFIFADGEVRDRASFFFVYTLYLLDEVELALETMEGLSLDPMAEYYPDYAVVAGEIYLTAGKPEGAARLLQRAVDHHTTLEQTDPLTAQGIYYLLGSALEEEDPERAERYFTRAAEIAPTTVVGTEAASR